jgi:hypothetical protein
MLSDYEASVIHDDRDDEVDDHGMADHDCNDHIMEDDGDCPVCGAADDDAKEAAIDDMMDELREARLEANMETYRLASSEVIFAPGMFKYFKVMFNTGGTDDKTRAIVLLESCWAMRRSIALGLLNGEIKVTIEGDKVVFTVDKTDYR